MDGRGVTVGTVESGPIKVRVTDKAPLNHNVFGTVNGGKEWFLMGLVNPSGPFITTTGFADICDEDRAELVDLMTELIGERKVILCHPPPPGFWDENN